MVLLLLLLLGRGEHERASTRCYMRCCHRAAAASPRRHSDSILACCCCERTPLVPPACPVLSCLDCCCYCWNLLLGELVRAWVPKDSTQVGGWVLHTREEQKGLECCTLAQRCARSVSWL